MLVTFLHFASGSATSIPWKDPAKEETLFFPRAVDG